jgi:hypothetical protein
MPTEKKTPAAKTAKAAAASKESAAKTATKTKRATTGAAAPSSDEIAVRAYYIYEQEQGGDPVAHWLRAESELTVKPRPRARAAAAK